MVKVNKKKKVVVAMSGGVDSSVAAALLKKQGFEVIGIFMKFWSKQHLSNGCCSVESEKKARQVAKTLNIPFYVLNFSKEFKKKVVDCFIKEHKAGFTPNPCVVCNKEIKFGLFLKKALSLKADYIATGHYARSKEKKTAYKLLKGKDGKKDQSYFLWKLNQSQLRHILFPVGDLKKKEVRQLARKFKLSTAEAKESQEICFVGESVEGFLKKYIKSSSGPIFEQKEGKIKGVVGYHDGLWLYTIGQRKGMGLAGGPYYVLKKDFKKNALIVTKAEKDLYSKELTAEDINWIPGETPQFPLDAKAKIRYSRNSFLARVERSGQKKIKVIFKEPQRAITPGQSVVFYKGDELLGGGIIEK